MKNSLSRRSFITSTLGAAVVFPQIVPSSVLGQGGAVSPNKRINVGVIGTGNQGTNDMRGLLRDNRVQIVAVCDVNRESAGYWDGAVAGRDPAKKIVEQYYAQRTTAGAYKGCDSYED